MIKPGAWSPIPSMLLLAAGLGCASAHAAEISLFSDQVPFAIDAAGPDQLAHGFFGGGSISGFYPTAEPGHVLMVTPPGDAVMGRHLDQPLTAPLSLHWAWRRLPPDSGQSETLTDDAPMRLIVGFKGGADRFTPSTNPPQQPRNHNFSALPAYDRALVITWADRYWESGASDRHGNLARFIAHGGPADGSWWRQSVDLGDLHERLWPNINIKNVRVSWVAVALRRSDGRSLGEVAGIALGD